MTILLRKDYYQKIRSLLETYQAQLYKPEDLEEKSYIHEIIGCLNFNERCNND